MSFQIVIPSLSRSKILKKKTLSTLERFGIPKNIITIFVIQEELEEYQAEVGDYKLVVGMRGIVQQREFIDNYFPKDEKILSLDDDIKDIDLDCFESLTDFINKAFDDCLKMKSFIWSVYPVWNPFFRKTKKPLTTELNFIIGSFYGYINRPDDIDLKITLTTNKEDIEKTIRYFIKDGIVLRYNKVGYKTRMFRNGGLGLLKDRLPNIIEDVKQLSEQFPTYGKVKIRKNGIWEFELKKIQQISKETFEVKQLPKLDKTEFNLLYELLSQISIPFKQGNNSRHNFKKHRATTFGVTRGRYNGIIGLSNLSKKYPKIYEEILRIGKIICPFEFQSIHLNHNVVCPKHKDSNNAGESLLISFGEYEGCKIVIDEKIYDANCSPIIFNGSQLEHYNTDDLVGNKYSLVYFQHKKKK